LGAPTKSAQPTCYLLSLVIGFKLSSIDSRTLLLLKLLDLIEDIQ
jgi:hypothetical protein